MRGGNAVQSDWPETLRKGSEAVSVDDDGNAVGSRFTQQ
jgi:hypothetical protein